MLSGSHDVVLDSGQIELIMYGSLLSGQKQYHHGLNQQLTSLTIHESIGEKTILDQFDVEVPLVFSGSYIDDIISGTLGYDENGILKNDRGVVASIVGAHYLISSTDVTSASTGSLLAGVTSSGSLLRAVVLRDNNETYYDSLVPNMLDIQRIDNGAIYQLNDAKVNILQMGTATPLIYGGVEISGNTSWHFSFPFQSKYTDVQRTTTVQKGGNSTYGWDKFSGQAIANYVRYATGFTISRTRRESNGSPLAEPVLDVLTSEPTTWDSGSYSSNILSKALFGFGRGRLSTGVDSLTSLSPQRPKGQKDNSPLFISPSFSNVTSGPDYGIEGALGGGMYVNAYRDVEIEGWKYGLKSGFATSPRMVLSRKHHGYLRDTLEQRSFTKYVIEGKTENGPVRVKFTLPNPSDTDSSNLHYEATSSLPYFDGDVRNRTAFTGYELVQIPIPGQDEFGQIIIDDLGG